MMRMFNLIFLVVLVSSTKGQVRETVVGEITPVSAELSSTYREAGYALDRVWSTFSLAQPGDDGTTWLKVKLGQVYCIDNVIVYYSSIGNNNSYSCIQDECTCGSRFCLDSLVSVYTEGTTASGNIPTTTGCKLGDTVKLSRAGVTSLRVYELVITDKLGTVSRETVAGEITPVSAEQSSALGSNEARFAIDRDLSTRSVALHDDDGKTWLKVKLRQVYCIDRVVRYVTSFPSSYSRSSYTSWSCTQDECTCDGSCGFDPLSLTVYTEGNTTTGNLQSTTGCRLGDTVKLYDGTGWSMIVHELVITSKLGTVRETVAGEYEVTPLSAEQSSTRESHEARYAIDRDGATYSWAGTGDDDTAWLKIKLEQVYCIDRVVLDWGSSSFYNSYSCSQEECTCEGKCWSYLLSVYTEGNATSGDIQPTSGCRLGDTVKVYSEDWWRIKVYELVITKLVDCTALNSTWENVVTDPQLPVEHGASIILGCTAGHVNIGGSQATCQNGTIAPTDEPPLCLERRRHAVTTLKAE